MFFLSSVDDAQVELGIAKLSCSDFTKEIEVCWFCVVMEHALYADAGIGRSVTPTVT